MDTTFRDQCMTHVFPRFIDGINVSNAKARNAEDRAERAEAKADALASEVAQLQAKVQELEETLAEIREHGGDLINDLLDRVNSLEAKAAEKKTRKPRAKKQADPVQMVEQAAQAAIVETPEQAMNELPF